jgi:hypothetical protein
MLKLMVFTIQYFATYDQLIFLEEVDVDELDYALDRARAVIKDCSQPTPDVPQLVGYVILDRRGRQVARGYRRDA